MPLSGLSQLQGRGLTELLHEHERKALADRIKAEIDEFCRVTYNDGHRSHLGASLMGHECNRYLWYVFRWVLNVDHGGRMERLFNRGHRQEDRFVHWLRGIGFEVWPVDPATGEQFRIYGVSGHYGGGLDGIFKMPVSYQIPWNFLLEMKTQKDGPDWKKLKALGVKAIRPKHFVQMCEYGAHYGFRYALYLAINKNDDDLHVEIVELDWAVGQEALRRAEYVIGMQSPPPRLNESPAYFVCKMCDFKDICHRGGNYEVNCRSCSNAYPAADGQWWCNYWQSIIPDEAAILAACGHHHEVGRR